MVYGSVVFSGRQVTGDRMLERVDRIASRMCSNDFSSDVEVLAARLGWTGLSVEARVRRLVTVHAYRLNYRPPPPMIRTRSPRRDTRTSDLHQCEPPPLAVREGVAMSCLRRGIQEYNGLPLETRQVTHMRLFAKMLAPIHEYEHCN